MHTLCISNRTIVCTFSAISVIYILYTIERKKNNKYANSMQLLFEVDIRKHFKQISRPAK